MKLATWNVNSLKVRLPQVLAWAGKQRPDVLCLQETKLEDVNFPRAEIEAAGYRVLFSGQKTYNGVAILSREPAAGTVTAIPAFPDEQKRVLAATIGGVRIACLYVPNGESVGSEKYQYKLRWLSAAREWLKDEISRNARLAVLGDFNVAPEARDVHDPELWEGKVLFSEPERAALRHLAEIGLSDAFRLFDQPAGAFTWWDYRMNGFRRKRGLRIDHILLSEPLAKQCTSCTIDIEPRGAERPSDHAPVIAEVNFGD
ncbi:MAG: exodeoxyribonuclease III [Betaproteobacteria bacterium]|nr:MAG: exodeoxyribonuclease III [Betaproteobacteria bacterium]